jgi:hypothetical protein
MSDPTESAMAGDPGPLGVYSDASRRISDTITLHLLADPDGNYGKWCAFRLSDGTSDGVVYDDPVAAADAQLHYKQCAYIQIHRSGISAKAASVMLTYYRTVYENGNVPPTLVAYQRAKLIDPRRNNR